jgi:predicted alpha/beta-hydrolase family hydrolase
MRDASEWRVRVGEDDVAAFLDGATVVRSGDLFVFAHGAGGNMSDRGMLALSSKLRAIGIDVVRFNFPYSEKRSRRPDPMPIVEQTIAAVCSEVRQRLAPRRLIIGGRSMGGRAASMLAADRFACDALLLLAYPLHPAGKPEQLRDAHLARIGVPVLCFNGTRDALCRRDLMEGVVARVSTNWTMHWLEGADHSFRVNKSTGRADSEILTEIGDATRAWLSRLTGPEGFDIPIRRA